MLENTQMKRIYIQFLLILLVSTFSINLQAQRLNIPEKSTIGDEFLIAPDGTYSELKPDLSGNCGCEISDLSFNWSGSFESAVANENLIRLARKRTLKKWYSNQINKVVKPAIDRKFGRTFSNFEEAKNELLIDSERKNITTLSRPLRDKYSRLRSRGFKAKEKHLKELKLLKLRESEIKSGNINNPSFGYTKVQGVYLKDIKSLSSLKSKWTPLFDDFSKNIAETHINNHMFKSIGRGVESEVIKLKNQHYNSLNTWDRLSLLQFLVHYEEYKKLSSPPYLVPEHINNMFKKFNNIDKATPELIENLSIKNRTGGFSVFDGRTYYKLLSAYTSPPALPGGEYMAKMEWERLKNQALDKLLNSTSTADFAITNLIGELNITNNTQKNWLYEHKTAANNFIGFANSNRVSNKITTKAKIFSNTTIQILSNQNLTSSQKYNQFVIAYNSFDPILPNTAQKKDYEVKIKKYATSFKQWGNKEFGNYLESLLPLDSSFSDEDYKILYKTIRKKAGELAWDYVRAIVGQTFESFQPVIEMALWEVGGGLALKVLSKLPVRYLTTPIKNVITRLRTPASSAFSNLKHAKKFGIQSYKQLGKQFKELGISAKQLGVEKHHLFEQRFVKQLGDKLGRNTDDWLSIVVEKTNKLAQSEHYKFTQAWKKAIGYDGQAAGWTKKTTSSATIDDIYMAAKEIYKDYPEILKALGL